MAVMARWVLCPFDELTGRQVHDVLRLRAEIFVVEQKCIFNDVDGCDQDGGEKHCLFRQWRCHSRPCESGRCVCDAGLTPWRTIYSVS